MFSYVGTVSILILLYSSDSIPGSTGSFVAGRSTAYENQA